MRRRSFVVSPSFVLCVLCALMVAVPLWTHRWLPIQDLPQHLATLRVVHEAHFGGPTRGLYDVDLSHTQYVLFYVVGDLLACVVSVRTAGLLMLTAYMVFTIASMFALLKALGRDPRLCLLAVPLLTNSQFLIGLLQFLIGIPLMLYGWSIAIQYLRAPRRRHAIVLAIVAVATFYTHVVIFGVWVIGLGVIAPLASWRRLWRYAMPLAPAGVLLLHWALFTRGGDFVRNAITSGAENKDLWPFGMSFHEVYRIAFDTYRDSSDEKIFAEAAFIGIVLTVLAQQTRRHDPPKAVSTARWLLIPLVCAVLYFRSEGTNGFLGHIRDRFSLLAMFAIIPTLRMPRGLLGHLGTVAMVVVSVLTAETFNWHCSRFESTEVGDFGQALAHIPPNKRVAGLIYHSESDYFGQNPFLHYVAYYLVESGGAVNFSFAGYPHWVYGYHPHQDALGASPPVFLWEWRPDRIPPREELAASYDYVLTRAPGFDPPEDQFAKIWETTQWAVWERRAQ